MNLHDEIELSQGTISISGDIAYESLAFGQKHLDCLLTGNPTRNNLVILLQKILTNFLLPINLTQASLLSD